MKRPSCGRKKQVVMAYLGSLLQSGSGISKDEAAAVKWLQKSADAKCGIGIYYLSLAYCKGLGTPKNKALASKWLKAAAAECSKAEHDLGTTKLLPFGKPQ